MRGPGPAARLRATGGRPTRAEAAASSAEATAPGPAGGGGRAVVPLAYYGSPGCRSCEAFLSEEVPALEAELGVTLALQRVDIFDPRAYEGYLRLLSRLDGFADLSFSQDTQDARIQAFRARVQL